MLRCQQFIELLRPGTMEKMAEGIVHAKKFVAPYRETYPDDVIEIAGLLAHREDTTVEPYRTLYSPKRWVLLADQFVEVHNQLLGLPPFPFCCIQHSPPACRPSRHRLVTAVTSLAAPSPVTAQA